MKPRRKTRPACTYVGRDDVAGILSTAGQYVGSNPGGGEIFHTPADGPWDQPTSCTIGTASFPRVKRPGRGVNHPHHLAPTLKAESSYTSTLLLSILGRLQGELHLSVILTQFGEGCMHNNLLRDSESS